MFDENTARESACTYRNLRRAGFTPRGTIDVVIATFCMVAGHVLVHRDRDFDAMMRHLPLETIRVP